MAVAAVGRGGVTPQGKIFCLSNKAFLVIKECYFSAKKDCRPIL